MKKNLFFIVFFLTPSLYARTTSNQARFFHDHMWSEYLRLSGEPQQAVNYAASNLERNAPVYAYKSYATALYAAQMYDQLVPLIQKLDTVFPDNPHLGLMTAQALEQTGNANAAHSRYIKLNERFKGNNEIAYHAVEAFMHQKEPENALRVIDAELNAAARRPNSFVFYFFKARILHQMGNLTGALENIRKCVELQPMFDKGWFLLAYLQEQQGKLNDAIKGYTNYLEITGGNKEIENHLIQLLFKQKMAGQKNNVIPNKDCYGQALQQFEHKEYAQALANIEQCMAAAPDEVENQLLKVRILAAMNKQEQVVQSLKEWLIKNPGNEQWYQFLTLVPKAGVSYKTVAAALAEVTRKHPKELKPLLYLADCYLRNKDHAQALPCLIKAVELTDNNSLKTKILFQIGVIHYTKKESAKAVQVLEKGRALHTDFPPLLNLLSYHYATDGKDLIRAQQLMNLVLHYDGKNPHFLDTQALIYFQQKNYPRALKMWHTIAAQLPDDFHVQKHLSQALFAQGNNKDAIDTLKRAQHMALCKEDKQECSHLLAQWTQAKK
jgi:predicted Zn-dependent protease